MSYIYIFIISTLIFLNHINFVSKLDNKIASDELKYSNHNLEDSNVVFWINYFRENPKELLKELELLKKTFDGKSIKINNEYRIDLSNDKNVIIDAINYVSKQKPLKSLSLSNVFSKVAMELIEDQSKNGNTGHEGSDGSMVYDRVKKIIGKNSIFKISEIIHYGDIEPKFIVINWILDINVKSRDHRKILLNDKFHCLGFANGSHPFYSKMCVVVLSEFFQN